MPSSALLRPALHRLLVLTALVVALLGSLLVAAPAADAATGSQIVAEAARHKGKPYKYGATGPSRFDCSGFTKYVFARMGKSIPRTSRDQYAASRKVAKSSKQVGDLVFTRNSSNRIVHVGVYAGSGYFWVSPKTGDVVKKQRIYTSNYVVGRY